MTGSHRPGGLDHVNTAADGPVSSYCRMWIVMQLTAWLESADRILVRELKLESFGIVINFFYIVKLQSLEPASIERFGAFLSCVRGIEEELWRRIEGAICRVGRA